MFYGEEQYSSAIEEFETALNLGLSPDDEIVACAWLGISYYNRLFAEKMGEDLEQRVNDPDFSKVIKQWEKTILLDLQGSRHFFEDLLHRTTFLTPLDNLYMIQGRVIKDSQGPNAAISYLKDKSGLVSRLGETYIAGIYFDLGHLYYEEGEISLAQEYLQKASEVEIRQGDDIQSENKQMAEDNLQVLAELEAESESPKSKSCFIATAVCERPDAIEIQVLQRFKSEFLLQSKLGRAFIHSYYCFSPGIAHMIEGSWLAKFLVRVVVVKPCYFVAKLCLGIGQR